MFDIAWEELALILAVALVVIGPKDLPAVLRTAGKWMRKIRGIAGEFQRTVDDAIRDAELEDVRQEVRKISQADLRGVIEKNIDPDGKIEEALKPPPLSSPMASSLPEKNDGGTKP